ncbi:MAG: hypothetical protein JSS98_04550 [Bacteroidetes bacterium]|nr:hypothetical protein [Bacteroidota bacterium]
MKFYLFILAAYWTSCTFYHEPNEKKITFVNQSSELVDSIILTVASKTAFTSKRKMIKNNDSAVITIPNGSYLSNGHDATVEITVYQKNAPPKYQYSYDDLAGRLLLDLTIILRKNQSLEWKTSHSKD